MIRTQIQLTESQAEKLKQLAAKQNVSMAEIIRRAIDTVIHVEGLVDHRERIQRARKIFGRFHSEYHDLAINHDQYLDDAYLP